MLVVVVEVSLARGPRSHGRVALVTLLSAILNAQTGVLVVVVRAWLCLIWTDFATDVVNPRWWMVKVGLIQSVGRMKCWFRAARLIYV